MIDEKEMLERIEIEIKFNKTRYQAKSLLFPECIGYGKTEKEALHQLGKSIGGMLGRLSQQTLSSLFSKDSFTEIVLDGASEKKTQRRVYGFNKSSLNRKLIGIEPISLDPIMNLKPEEFKDEAPIEKKESEDDYISFQDPFLTESIQMTPQSDGITFGFHISMN